MQGQARFHSLSGQAGPGAEEIPSAQAQVFGQEQPHTNLIARNFVGQSLADLSFQAFGIGWNRASFFAGTLGLDELGRVGGIKGIEFFFCKP